MALAAHRVRKVIAPERPAAIILALNVGSSSLKFDVYEVRQNAPVQCLAGTIAVKDDGHDVSLAWPDGRSAQRHRTEREGPLEALVALEETRELIKPAVVAHRFVHGGLGLREHAVVDENILPMLEAAAAFAPLHVPPALDLLRHAMDIFPAARQVACLDTAFHRHLPEVARVLPLPGTIRQLGVQRFGFHGLSCESIVRQLGDACPARLVIAHLGSGCSITAVHQRTSIDTSMGLTPTGGVVMGTRPGDLDPGVLLYLLREQGFDAAKLEDLIEHHSGLAGLSGSGSDVRQLLQDRDTQPAAKLALAQFTRSTAKQIAAMAVSLGGIDMLVFTGGVGEHAKGIRADIQAQLAPLHGPFSIEVLPAREDEVMAHHAWRLCRAALQTA